MTVKTAAGRATSVLVVAASADRRRALRAKLAGLEIETAEISTADWSVALSQARPGVAAIVDLEPDQSEAAGKIAELGAGVVVLIEDPEPGWVARLVASGVRAVLRSDCSTRQLAAALQAAEAGLAVLEPETLLGLLHPPLEAAELEPGEEELTPRETEVLRMMTAGLSNREIASTLGISEHTVKFHITSIFGKLGTTSRTEAVTEGLRRGLVLL